MSDSHKGRVAWNRGKSPSLEHRIRVAEGLKGIKRSATTKEKMRAARKNWWEQEKQRIAYPGDPSSREGTDCKEPRVLPQKDS